ncbi:MAG: hypothetical protein ACI38V_04270 [Bacteroides sp.]
MQNDYNGYNDSCIKPCRIFYFFALLIIISNFLVTIYYNGFKLKLDLNDVYDIRFAVRDMHLPTIVQYLKPLASKVTLMTIMILLMQKKYQWVAFLTIIQLMNFAFGALKSDLFALLLAYIFGIGYKPQHRQYVLYGLLFSNIFVIIEYLNTGISYTSIVIHRRVLFMPALLSYEYYDYFSMHELVYLRDSFMRFFGFSSPYDLEIPRLIGRELYAKEEMNCNTGILGDDFAQLGWISIIIFPLLRIKLLGVYDRMCNGINQNLIIFISFVYSLVFISGTFFSSLLTGGFIGILFLLHLFNYKKN